MSNQEKAAAFAKELAALEEKYDLVLSAYSGTGDFYVTFFNQKGQVQEEVDLGDLPGH